MFLSIFVCIYGNILNVSRLTIFDIITPKLQICQHTNLLTFIKNNVECEFIKLKGPLMENFLILLAFPLIWPWIAKRLWNSDVTWQEMFLNVFLIVIIVSAIWFLGKNSQTADTEIWNGQVTSKEQNSVPCSHSYSCHCRSTKNGTSCDICYEHTNDWDWDVHSTAGDFTINRIDRRGSDEPPRWTAVKPGQPVALEHSFTNYVKAVPESLFNHNQQALSKWGSSVPPYPTGVYDYQYLDRVLPVGVNVPDLKRWNYDLALMLRELGPAKQVNVIVVITNVNDPTYEYALQGKWQGAKKNDVVVILGTPNYPNIEWARVVSWTDNQLFKVQLRDALLDLKTVNEQQVLSVIGSNVAKSFARKHMRDFKYLDEEIMPPDWVLYIAIAIAIFGSIGLSVFFKFYDVDLTSNSIISQRSRFRGRYGRY